jgi:hypothetical protein
VEDRELARQLALGRVAIGAASVVAPGITLRGWFGKESKTPTAKALGRAFGIRDALLGLGTLQAIDRDDRVKEWLTWGVAADATDFMATLLARKSLAKRHVFMLGITAGSATVIGAVLASRWG